MKITSIASKNDLLFFREEIEDLFYSCFGQRSIGAVWDWAYLDNPNGEPIVTLCHDNERLVGHYAIVPMPLSNAFQSKNSYISMTTMVAESHRKFGLFTMLAQASYSLAAENGVDFVFGFPNGQSTPGFRKRLNWMLPESDYVATIDKNELEAFVKKGGGKKYDLLGLNLMDQNIREWRLSRPGAFYQFENGVAFKVHNDSLDLLWWESPECLYSLPDDKLINFLVLADSGLQRNIEFDYQFGGIGLCSSFDAAGINREMAISDLF
ncbi:GNAT family N-acetyltransferase [Chromobacterium haemolyticum]|uniref:GNAT family N-acetyltransferase n=1 Tax=Chromobacterium haemolyticum TaxID=394935 RepID=UPI0009DA0CA9|nr:GNAT family N-acetyltransferase [Chromobacterium haemolyticum]OQS42498.1 hypothetical protein B0T39_05485 [Chromobacterium haemolyticum]